MPQLWAGQPFWLALGLLTLVALARGQGTYWLARVATEQALARTSPGRGWRAATHRWLQGEGPQRGRRALQRWGLVAIPLCYLTVGFQTMVLAAAGMVRLGWLRFTLAQLPGALAWGLIYTTIGFAAWSAALAAAAGSPLALGGLLALALVLVGTLLSPRARARRASVHGGRTGA